MSLYAQITPHHLAALSLQRAASALEAAALHPETWFFVILDLNRALHCALIAALSGSSGIGAFKNQTVWLRFFEESRDNPNAKAPTGEYVLPFKDLLTKAENELALQLSPEQRADILMLNVFRADLEHVKPSGWSLSIAGLPRICARAANAFAVLLEHFCHRLEEHEQEQVKVSISKFEHLARHRTR
jgi:hypothetical protein